MKHNADILKTLCQGVRENWV